MARTYWIGGGTGGGKSTVARALAARYGLRRFALDAFWYAYAGDEPRKSPDEQWLRTPPEAQAEEFEQVSRIMHEAAIAELARLPSVPTVVEGPQVQPDLVPRRDRAVFLLPTPGLQRSVLEPRPMPSSDPARALANRLVKDRLYADRIGARARAYGFPVVEVDGTRDVAGEAAELLGVEPAQGVDLRAVRRWENEAVAANLRAWLASPEAPREPLGAVGFQCECGRPGCDAHVPLTLEQFAAAEQVLAH